MSEARGHSLYIIIIYVLYLHVLQWQTMTRASCVASAFVLTMPALMMKNLCSSGLSFQLGSSSMPQGARSCPWKVGATQVAVACTNCKVPTHYNLEQTALALCGRGPVTTHTL